MGETRSAWGVIKARTMRGADDRSDFYRFWYCAWELGPREEPVKGWWAIPVPKSRLAAMFQSGGNLVLTNKRLLWEPLATKAGPRTVRMGGRSSSTLSRERRTPPRQLRPWNGDWIG